MQCRPDEQDGHDKPQSTSDSSPSWVPFVQVGGMHTDATQMVPLGHCVVSEHWMHEPWPLQSPKGHGVPSALSGYSGFPFEQISSVQSSPSPGASSGSFSSV